MDIDKKKNKAISLEEFLKKRNIDKSKIVFKPIKWCKKDKEKQSYPKNPKCTLTTDVIIKKFIELNHELCKPGTCSDCDNFRDNIPGGLFMIWPPGNWTEWYPSNVVIIIHCDGTAGPFGYSYDSETGKWTTIKLPERLYYQECLKDEQ